MNSLLSGRTGGRGTMPLPRGGEARRSRNRRRKRRLSNQVIMLLKMMIIAMITLIVMTRTIRRMYFLDM